MRILAISLIGLSALALSACDEFAGGRQTAKADCCCDRTCPTPAPTPVKTPPSAAPATTGQTTTTQKAGGATSTRAVKSHGRRGETRWASRGGKRDYSYRSGTEGVGYLDEDLVGGYRRVGVSAQASESYSESSRYSESSSAYGYSEGGAWRDGDERRGGGRRGHGGRGGYTGVDRDGYLTWPGKTPSAH
jgi:hypothetical protein